MVLTVVALVAVVAALVVVGSEWRGLQDIFRRIE